MNENETGMSSLHGFVPIVVVIHVGLQFESGYKRARRVEEGWHQTGIHRNAHEDLNCWRLQQEYTVAMLHIFCQLRLRALKMTFCDALFYCPRFYGKLLQSLMDCDEDTVDRVRTSMVSRLGPEMTMLIQLLQNKPCPSTAVAAAAAIPTGVEGRGSWRWSMGPHMYKIQPNLRNRDSASHFGKKRSASDSS